MNAWLSIRHCTCVIIFIPLENTQGRDVPFYLNDTVTLRFSDGSTTLLISNRSRKTVELIHNSHANINAILRFQPRITTYPVTMFTDPRSIVVEIANDPATILQMSRNTEGAGDVEITDNFRSADATYDEKQRTAMRDDLQSRIHVMINLCCVTHRLSVR